MKTFFPLLFRRLWFGLLFGVCSFLSAAPADAAPYFVTVSVLNLRSCKGTNCKIVAKLTFGEIVDASDDDGSWVKVETQKGNGYVDKRYLKKAITPSENSGHNFFYGVLFVFLAAAVFNRKKEEAPPPTEKAPDDNKKATLYDLLGICSEASPNEIKRAYKTLAKKYHPDLNPDKAAAEQFRKINEAYETLKDEQKRAAYNANLKTSQTKEHTEEKILLAAGSIQELRGTLSESLNIPLKEILFTRNGNVFIKQQYVFRWRPVKQEMIIDRRHLIKTYFECFSPENPYPDKRDGFELESVFLTAPDILSFKRCLGIYFDREEKRISLADDGRVYVDGTPDWLWNYSDDGYFEYYFSTDDDI